MDITPLVSPDRQIIKGYGDLGFTISGVRWEGSVLVFPDRTVPWPVEKLADATPESLAEIINAGPHPDVVVLGCGRGMLPVPRALREIFRVAGIVVEPMDTGAACRTFNVLLTEDRRVAAALIAV